MAVKQTAGRNSLGDLAPKFAELNDDVLFGEVWSREDKLSLRDRCIVTVTALMAKGITDNSIKYHIENAKNHGVTKTEMVELITHGTPNIVCIQPFACLPNHIVGKGVIKELRRKYPESNIVAIDYDPGASEVNQLNRIKLMISTAQKNLPERKKESRIG
mgnify:CR=1 FL=1